MKRSDKKEKAPKKKQHARNAHAKQPYTTTNNPLPKNVMHHNWHYSVFYDPED